MSVSPSSGSEIEEAILDEVGGSDESSDAGRGAFAPHAPSGVTRPGGESGSGGSARGHSETYSDDFGSGDDGVSENGAFVDEPVDDAPESPAAQAPGPPNAFATRVDTSAPEEMRQGARSAAPARDASGAVARASEGEGAAPDPGRSGASSPRVFRWERSPSPDRRDAARAETGRRASVGAPDASSRRAEPAWASVPGRVAALVARARALSARRETVAAMSPAARAARRYENDPAPVAVGPLTMAKARARRAATALRAEAAAVRASVAARAAAHRERVTPDLARAMYVRRAIARAAALDGARVVANLEREAKARGDADAPETPSSSSTLEVLRAAIAGGDGDGDGDGDDVRFGTSHPPLGRGKQALLRRLWASHRLRRAAAECLGGDAETAVGAPPRAWAELHLGRASGSADDWYDESSGRFGKALDAFARGETSEEGQNAVSVLRASAELRRRAGVVLAP